MSAELTASAALPVDTVQTADRSETDKLVSNDEPAERECEVSIDYINEKADVELVSSDGVIFKVHSYQLKSASLVFRDILGDAPFDLSHPRSIVLTDEHLERAVPMKDFLDCIHGEDLFVIIKEYRRAKDLIGLLYKYDCPAWLAILRTSVRLASARMTGTHDAHDLFKLSAALSDPIGCSEALPGAAELTWADDCDPNAAGDKAKMDQNITDKSVLDVAGMCEDELTKLPLAYIGALARGWT